MSRPFPYLLLAAAVLLAIPLQSIAESCPLSLQEDALTVRAPAGWRGYTPSPMKLTGFGMMGGDPQSMTYLVPEASSKTKSGGKITWRHGSEMWLFCTYDDSSAIQISKRLSGGESCTASYTKKDGAIEAMKVECSTSSAPMAR